MKNVVDWGPRGVTQEEIKKNEIVEKKKINDSKNSQPEHFIWPGVPLH